jgi:error-prone DNA polymerase
VVGLVNSRQRPATASGTVFLSLEDETGMANVIVWPRLFREFREVILDHSVLLIDGVLERNQGTQNIIARRIRPLPT